MSVDDVVAWLRSAEGEAWSHNRVTRLESQAHREGQMFTLEPPEEEDWRAPYRPCDDKDLPYYVSWENWIYEPDSVAGLSSPA
jgi:hypothetical protein